MSVPGKGGTDDALLHRVLMKKMLVFMVGIYPGSRNYVPEYMNEVEDITDKTMDNFVDEVELTSNNKFWLDFWKHKRGDEPTLNYRDLYYYTPTLLGCFDTLVADVSKEVGRRGSCTTEEENEAVGWWHQDGRMLGFDNAFLGMWDFPPTQDDSQDVPPTQDDSQ